MSNFDFGYRTLNDELKKKLFSSTKAPSLDTYFNEDGKNVTLENSFPDDPINISDKNSDWSPLTKGLNTKLKLSLNNLDLLWDAQEGVAYTDSKLGISFTWVSRNAKQRGKASIMEIKSSMEMQNFEFPTQFPPFVFNKEIDFSLDIVLLDKGTPNREFGINNNQGVILGNLLNYRILLSGNGSEFPCVYINEPQKPLWSLKLGFEDVQDQFGYDTVCLCINKGNNDYKYLDKGSSSFDSRLKSEIMAEAISNFVIAVEEDALGESIENPPEGSVLGVERYMVKVHQLDVKRKETILPSIIQSFEKERGIAK